MSYQALARKWRPRNFEEVVGQEHVVSALTNALQNQRVHHAYLFTGTRGVGKTTLARIFARALNCEEGISASPCGQCIACRGVDQGNYIDLIEVDAASRTRVDDTRELLDNVQYAPTQGRFKIYLIDEVHMLSGHSFNALLKTLEEPPAHVKFLLATTDPQKLPATVLSRCIQFNLKAMDIPRLNGQMEKILKAENIKFEKEALIILSRSADGSVRDALSLLDQAIAFGDGKVQTTQVRTMLGMIDDHFTAEILHHVVQQDATAVLDTVSRISERSVDYQSIIDELLGLLHDIALHQVSPQAIEWKGVDLSGIAELSEQIDPELLQLLYQIGLIGKRDLALAPDPRIGFEMLMLRMTAFQPANDSEPSAESQGQRPAIRRPEKTSMQSEKKQHKTSALKKTTDEPLPANEAHPQSLKASLSAEAAEVAESIQSVAKNVAESQTGQMSYSLQQLVDPSGWRHFAEQSGLSGISKELVMNMVPQSLQDNRLSLLLDQGSQHLLNDARKKKLQDFCHQHTGVSVNLAIVVAELNATVGETPSQQNHRQQQERQSAAEEAFTNDPNVQQLVDLFDAEVISDSIQPGSG